MSSSPYKLVQLRSGTYAVYAAAYDEKMHPGLGPAAEAEAVYIRQLKVCERMAASQTEFIVWDIGLGAAANALTLLRLTRDLPCPLQLVSFDDTAGPAEFALQHANKLGYFAGYESHAEKLLSKGSARFVDGTHEVNWPFVKADFPTWLQREPKFPAPDAIMFDAFSPARNPAMWTLPLFTNLFRQLDPARPCNLTTYSRSTMLRVTLLLAGFLVGRGVATGLKEETTVAANSLSLLDEPLNTHWLERARRSDSAEPLHEPVYRQAKLSMDSLQKLERHPQFCQSAVEPK